MLTSNNNLLNNNLVAIAYKTGYCGSLIYTLFALSPEVRQYCPIDKLTFDDSTAHEYEESWFNKLHRYDDGLDVFENRWESLIPIRLESYLTDEVREALKNKELILFRCHPNTILKLSFIKNLKVLYVTHCNRYIPERWAYEKVYKHSDSFYQDSLQKLYNSSKNFVLTDVIKRNILIRNLNHNIESYENLHKILSDRTHQIKIDRILNYEYEEYLDACKFLQISPIPESQFLQIIETYNSKQWKRF